ncbi:MAG: phosphatase PAP2 family protein [Candidatus Cloacimonadales bacterium]
MKIILILLFILLLVQMSYAQVFEVDRSEFLYRTAGWGVISLSNNLYNKNYTDKIASSTIEALEADEINFFDQAALMPHDETPKAYSDYTAYATLLTAGWLAYDNEEFWDNMLVFSEVLIAQEAAGKWTKSLSKRYRPLAYDQDLSMEHRTQKNSLRSFYSLHTSTAFAAATFGYYLRYKSSGHSWGYGVALYGTAAATGYLRVASGQHFPTDIMAGALVGSAISYLICRSYQSSRFSLNLAPDNLGFSYKF